MKKIILISLLFLISIFGVNGAYPFIQGGGGGGVAFTYSNYFNQNLNTTNSVTFSSINITGKLFGNGENLTGINGSSSLGGNDGSIQYNNGGVLGGSDNLYWNDTHYRLGIGTNSPIRDLHVQGNTFLNGSVGVGIVAPFGKFEVVEGANASTQYTVSSYSDVQAKVPIIALLKSSSPTIGAYQTTTDGESLGSIKFMGVDSGNSRDIGVRILATQVGAAGAKVPSKLVMTTFSSTAENTNQLVLYSDGNVGIGTADPKATVDIHAANSVRDIALHSNYADILFNDTDTGSYSIVSGGSTFDVLLYENTALLQNRIKLNTVGLGINDTSPDFNLEVVKSPTSANGAFAVSSTASSDGDIFIVNANNHVGIGTKVPRVELDVVGTQHITTPTNTDNFISIYPPHTTTHVSDTLLLNVSDINTNGEIIMPVFEVLEWKNAGMDSAIWFGGCTYSDTIGGVEAFINSTGKSSDYNIITNTGTDWCSFTLDETGDMRVFITAKITWNSFNDMTVETNIFE